MSRKRKVSQEKRDFTPRPITAKNFNQGQYIDSIKTDEVVIAVGSAGTGKTFISSALAADMYMEGDFNKIILSRPTTPCGEDLGALPGTLDEKFEPWMHPFISAMKTRMSSGAWDCAIKNNIQFVPLQIMRGASFDDAFIIIDEAQNLNIEQAKMIITRIGWGSKLVINGDINQTDLKCGDNGLSWLVKEIKKQQLPIDIIEFTIDDCVRSDVCKMFLNMIDKS